MAVLKSEKHFLIRLTFAKKADGSLREIYVSERSCPADYLYSGSPDTLGILSSTSGFGQSMGEVVSKNQSGTIALKSVIGTLAFNQRVIDLLEEYVIVKQDIRGWSFEKATGRQGDIADLAPEFVGTVAKTKIDPVAQLLIIEVDSNDFSTAVVNNRYDNVEDLILASNYSELGLIDYQIEKSGQNNFAPIVFGKDQEMVVSPLATISYFTGNDEPYVVASLLGAESVFNPLQFWFDFLPASSIFPLYANVLDNFNIYRSIQFNSSAGGWGYNTGISSKTGDIYLLFVGGFDEVRTYFFPLGEVNSYYTYSALFLGILSQNIGSWDGEVSVQIMECRFSTEGIPNFKEVPNAKGTVSFKDWVGSSYLSVTFDVAFTPTPGMKYYVRMKETGALTQKLGLTYNTSSTPYQPVYYIIENADEKNIIPLTGTNVSFMRDIRLTAAWWNSEIEVYPSADRIINPTKFRNYEIRTPTSALATELKNKATEINGMIAVINGACDTLDNDITGTPPVAYTTVLVKAYHILKALYFLQNGNSVSGWDTSRFADAETRSVNLGGVEYEARTYRQLMLDIAEAGSAALIKNRDGTTSFWTYTCEQEPVDIITERDCVLESIESLGVESMVNSISLGYQRKETPLQNSSSQQSYFSKLMTKTDANSQGIYGVLEPDSIFQQNVWIDNFDAAERYTDYKIQQQAFERFEFTITVSYWKNRYRFHELWDLVWLSHIELPSRYGALPPNKVKPLGEGVDWAIGDVLRQAKSYLCRIVERIPVHTDGRETGLRFVLRTLGEKEQF